MRNLLIILLVFSVALASHAIPDNNTDVALGIKKALRTTFENTAGAFDGVISSDPEFSAKSGDIYSNFQVLRAPLPKPFYTREIKIYFDKDTYYPDYKLNISTDGVGIFEYKVDQDKRIEEVKGNSLIHTYEFPDNPPVFAVRLAIKGDPTDKVKKGAVIIQEIEIFSEMDKRLDILSVDKVITDTEAYFFSKMSLMGQVYFSYKEQGSDAFLSVIPAPVGESAGKLGLKPGQVYDYQIKALDYNANIAESPANSFTTKPLSLAKNAIFSGSFVNSMNAEGKSKFNDDDLKESADSGDIFTQDQELIIDLGQAKQVSTVVVFWRQLSYSRDYSIWSSNDGNTWQELAAKIDAGKAFASRSLGSRGGVPIKVMETSFEQKPARYVKILIKKDSDFYHKHTSWTAVQITEVKVF